MSILAWVGVGILVILAAVLTHDLLQKRSAILHNFPIIGWLRYLLIEIGPELRQYLVAHNREEAPFNRLEREWIYASAERGNNTFGFGTDDQIYGIGYPIIKHAVFPVPDEHSDPAHKIPAAKIIGAAHGRAQPYRPASIINISAMSFGSLSGNAISALNRGALQGGCYHNTGEGGVSPYHLLGGDLCWQLGTAYFGCRDEAGNFSLQRLVDQVEQAPQIKLIEVKLSQGAKPGKGGILPAAKVTAEIAKIRGIPVGKTCFSPNHHSAFSDVDSLIDFIEEIAAATGLPVGIKAAIGKMTFWEELARRMKARGCGPDFITIDGGEGGTGAAPLTFTDHVALPFKIGFSRVYQEFLKHDLCDGITFVGSGKLGFPDRCIVAFAMGVDLINVAREAMLAIGCIQAQKCHTGHCPAGVATQSTWLQRGLDPTIGGDRFQGYVEAFRKEVDMVTRACGYRHPGQFTGTDIEISTGPNRFSVIKDVFGYDTKQYHPDLEPCSAENTPCRDDK
jgi:glutamate synthase (ferredoxin)